MHQLFIELYNYRDAWQELPEVTRAEFVGHVLDAIRQLEQAGVEVIAFGPNDPSSDRRAPYDFYCVYRVPSADIQRAFEREIRESAWYDFFDQVNVSGPAYSAAGGLTQHIALEGPGRIRKAISDAMPFEKSYISAHGQRIAYVDTGSGPPVVFLHGDMMSSYMWRNIIPYVMGSARCIAVDLVGMGDSDKIPEATVASYTFQEHYRFLDGFLGALGLDSSLVIVGHDWGANLAMSHARRRPDTVSGLAFCEPLLPPFTWDRWPHAVHDLFRLIRSPEGPARVMDTNLFVEGAQSSILRRLSEKERAEYRRPFFAPGEGRLPTWRWPASVPLDGEPADVAEAIDADVGFLATSDVPKLFIDGEPGAVIDSGRRETIHSWRNVTTAKVEGLHWPPEDSPHEIGSALASWIQKVRS